MKDFNLQPTSYPAIFYPRSILRALEATPPEPPLNLIPLPSKPVKSGGVKPPSFNKLPPQRMNYNLVTGSVAAAIIFVAIAASVGGAAGYALLISATVAIVSAVSAFTWQWVSYPERLGDYRREKQKHEYALEEFRKAQILAEKNYQSLLKAYENQCQECERQNEQIRNEHRFRCAEMQKPEFIEQWRQSQLASISFRPAGLDEPVDTDRFDPRGYAEYESNSQLPSLLRQYFNGKIHVLRYVKNRIPDFAYVDSKENLSIDIEIDEPYTPRQYPQSSSSLKLTHCLGQDEYDDRTKTFQSNDWFVLFFSERQALHYPRECCKAVAQLIDEITGSQLVSIQFKGVQDIVPESRWTESQARAMAERRERLNYRSANNYSYSHQRLFRDIIFEVSQIEVSQISSETSKPSDSLTSSNSVSIIPNKKAKKLIRKKFRLFLMANRDLQPNRINAQKFLEDLIHPSKTGQASHWVRVNGIQEALVFLEDYKPELD